MHLREDTRRNLERAVGISLDEIAQMDFDDEIAFVTAKRGKPPVFPKEPDFMKDSGGNPLIAQRRFCTMEEIDERIAKIK